MPKIRRSQELQPKPLFLERMKTLLENEEDFESYTQILNVNPKVSIRCNTLKISPEKLKERLEKKGWKLSQPFKRHPEIIIITSNLLPGELGKSLEHLLGYYYAQEIASMLPVLILNPKEDELELGRLKVLKTNLERCGAANVIITKREGSALCEKLHKESFGFDKILIDAPCSGEGTLRSTPKGFLMWNINNIKQFSNIQKKLLESALKILNRGGTLIYSTCTHTPEENEEVIDFALKNFKDIKIERITLPKELKVRQGITKWNDKSYSEQVKHTCRIYPQDNNTEGFFIAKLIKK